MQLDVHIEGNREKKKIPISVRNEKIFEMRRKRRCQSERTQKESQINRSVVISRRSNAKRNPHAIIGFHQNAHIATPKVDANGGTRVHSSTQTKSVKTSGKGTIVIISNETKEFNC